ncbi:pentatricopeptide repeat-containing protein At3g62470, mitochondrial [Ziziphus jujuba]|uniref:Pentatricopeptide repeat-containing protein At3g62470, mitochondrial n=1 Tax=Ziziphus jujuba TaxID=326968 RepID=A0ABM3IBE2_ZIZJJ|nr:pentatricopeptide repeat-containing protein At3g62470, mitochondrial [Ziziphus jujuba]
MNFPLKVKTLKSSWAGPSNLPLVRAGPSLPATWCSSQFQSFTFSHLNPLLHCHSATAATESISVQSNSFSLVHGPSMSLFLIQPSKVSKFLRRFPYSQPHSSFSHGFHSPFFTTQLRSAYPRRRTPPETRRRSRREQLLLPSRCLLPMSGLLYSPPHCGFNHPCCQIPFLLPHSSPFSLLQEELLTPIFSKTSKFRVFQTPNSDFLGKFVHFGENFSGFSSVSGGDADSNGETDIEDNDGGERDGNEGVGGNSGADPEEVERVCKVIDELFALDRNMEAVLDECGIDLSHDLVVDVLERFRHARKPAFRFFCWAGMKPGFSHNSRTYNSMMNILGKTRQFETMVSLLEEMGERGTLTMETFMIAIKAFAAAKERKKAVAVFELMKKYKFKVGVDTYNCLLDTLGRAKLGKEAQALYEKLKLRFTPDLQTYTVLINGWCEVKNLMEAGRLWNEMIEMGFKPDIVAYNVMLEGLLRSKKRSDAIKLFEVMKAKGPPPNVRSYTILIRDFCKQGKLEEAVEYFDEMVESGYRPDAAIYTCLITGFGNQKKMEMVYELLKEMKEKGCAPDGRTYNSLIKLMTNRRMPDDAMRIYKRMVRSGIEPTIHTYNMIMKSYFWTRNYDMGRAIWDEMIQMGICPDDNSYTVFIGGLISQGRSGEAYECLEEMIERGMKAPQLDYNKFAADFSRAGKPEILEELSQKMKFAGKFEVSNVFARWAEMMRKRIKRSDITKTGSQ